MIVSRADAAFQVSSSLTSIVASQGPIKYDKIDVCFCSSTEWYDMSSGTFITTDTALYWLHFTAGVPANTAVNYFFNGLNNIRGIVKSNTLYPQDQVTSDGMQWIPKKTLFSMSTSYSLFNSGPLFQTALLWFRLDTFFQPLVALRVVRTTSQYSTPPGYVMPFDAVIVNEGLGWDVTNNKFVTPVAGNYYVSFGIGAEGGKQACMTLSVRNQESIYLCIHELNSRNNIEIARNAIMVYLNQGDILFAKAVAPVNYYSDSNCQVFLQAFLYSPQSSLSPVAWSVSRSLSNTFTGPIEPLVYDVVNVNVGGAWNAVFNNVTIKVAGAYYIDLGTYLSGCASPYVGNCSELVQLLRNKQPIIEVKMDTSLIEIDGVTRSRSSLVQLAVGDELHVRMPTVNSNYINSRTVNVLMGFLINPSG